MGTRLHRIGTIFSRTEALLRKGHLQEENKPIWFDVYKQFPPKYEPTFKRKAPDVTIREIFYKEDVLRAKIHNEFEGRLGLINLNSKRESRSKIMLRTCQQYIAEGMSESEAIEKLKVAFGTRTEEPQEANVTRETNEG